MQIRWWQTSVVSKPYGQVITVTVLCSDSKSWEGGRVSGTHYQTPHLVFGASNSLQILSLGTYTRYLLTKLQSWMISI